jgi:hypothetical protein
MARSGSYDFNVTRDDIINGAFRLIAVLGTDQTASSTMLSDGSQALNMMCKAWQGQGMGLWLNKEIVLFPQADQTRYYLGPSMQSTYGDYACLIADYAKTEMATAGVATDTTLVVDSITGFTNGDFIGIETDNGDIHWTTINGVPAGTSIVITTGLDYASAVDSHVYGFTTIPQRPLEIMHAWRRDGSENDVDIDIVALDDYRTQTFKTTEAAAVTMLSVDKQLDDVIIHLWPEPNDMKYRIHMVVKYPVQDFDGGTDDPDFPQEWFAALKYNLAVHLAAEYSRVPSKLVMGLAESTLNAAAGGDMENASLFLRPNVRGYKAGGGYRA